MRERLRRPFRPRTMARRPGDDDRIVLSPRARRLGGWLAALLLVVGVAVGVRILGGNGDGSAPVPEPSGTGPVADPATIVFGTAIDPVTGEVAEASRTDRFVDGDAFAYSVRPDDPPPSTIHVEVVRSSDDRAVQPPSPQGLPDGATVIAFVVPAANLVRDFGEGRFEMRIYLDPAAAPIATGTFELIAPLPSPGGSG